MNRLKIPSIHDIIITPTEDEPLHQVLSLRAGDKIRVFCNYLWCTYDEILSDPELLDLATTEHESLNFPE